MRNSFTGETVMILISHLLQSHIVYVGIVCEKTLFTSNPLLPHIRRRINDDLSGVPSPYQLLQQMLIGPGLFSGFSFLSERSGIATPTEIMHN